MADRLEQIHATDTVPQLGKLERSPFLDRTMGDGKTLANANNVLGAAWKQRTESMHEDASPPSTPWARLFTLFLKVHACFSFSKQRAESPGNMSEVEKILSSRDAEKTCRDIFVLPCDAI